jgi:IPT/TIG domain
MRLTAIFLLALLATGCGAGRVTGLNSHPILASTAVPSIKVLVPNNAPVNSVPFTMTVNGNNFGTDAVVFWNNTPHRTFFVSPHQLVVPITDTDLSFAGQANVFVQTAGTNSNTVTFDVSIP